jgi:hypothetical protein
LRNHMHGRLFREGFWVENHCQNDVWEMIHRKDVPKEIKVLPSDVSDEKEDTYCNSGSGRLG